MSAENLETLCNEDNLDHKSSPDSKESKSQVQPNSDPNN